MNNNVGVVMVLFIAEEGLISLSPSDRPLPTGHTGSDLRARIMKLSSPPV